MERESIDSVCHAIITFTYYNVAQNPESFLFCTKSRGEMPPVEMKTTENYFSSIFSMFFSLFY